MRKGIIDSQINLSEVTNQKTVFLEDASTNLWYFNKVTKLGDS